MIIRILDILASVLTLSGLWFAPKNRKWWLVYLAGAPLFITVCISKGLIGLTVFGCVTVVIGIKNYLYEEKEEEISNKTWQAQIFCGLRKGYSEEVLTIDKIYRTCQKYVDRVGWCVTVTPTKYIYKDGNEPGVIVEIIQYPRFPTPERILRNKTLELANILLVELGQQRLTVCFPDKTILLEKKE